MSTRADVMADRRRREVIGWACLAGFVACILLANYAISNWGTQEFPGGPHTVTILGLTAPSGVLFVGLSFSLRDGAQLALGRWHVLGAIALGAALSFFVAPSLAWASAAAFLVSETGDWAVYTRLSDEGHLVPAIVLSNTVGSAVDTVVFLWLAFDWAAVDHFFWGQFWLKLLMTIPALLIVVPLRLRRHQALT